MKKPVTFEQFCSAAADLADAEVVLDAATHRVGEYPRDWVMAILRQDGAGIDEVVDWLEGDGWSPDEAAELQESLGEREAAR